MGRSDPGLGETARARSCLQAPVTLRVAQACVLTVACRTRRLAISAPENKIAVWTGGSGAIPA